MDGKLSGAGEAVKFQPQNQLCSLDFPSALLPLGHPLLLWVLFPMSLRLLPTSTHLTLAIHSDAFFLRISRITHCLIHQNISDNHTSHVNTVVACKQGCKLSVKSLLPSPPPF